MSDCIFCRIVCGEAPAHVVFEDERTLVFLDIMPVSEGHVLIVPKAHSENLFEIDPEDLRAVAMRSHAVAAAIRRVFEPDGIGVHQLNGAAAGQTVFHYHMHLIPRAAGGSGSLHGRKAAPPEQLAAVAATLARALEAFPA